MAEKLKIYACSGIGDAEQQSYTYWTDNTQTVDNTQAVNSLLAQINLYYTEAVAIPNMPDHMRILCLDNLDMLCVALEAAKLYSKDAKKLYHAGEVIAVMQKDGAFQFDSLDDAERDVHLDSLLDRFHDLMKEDDLHAENPEFMEWWKKTVCERNKVGLNAEERKATRNAIKAVKGLGEIDESWKEDKDISEYLLNAGTYFLYLYYTEEQLSRFKNRKVIEDRIKCQKRIYNYCKAYFVGIYGSEEEMESVIRCGIIQEFGAAPEDVCEAVSKGEKKIGQIVLGTVTFSIMEFIQLLTLIAGVLVAIITAICDCVYKSNAAKYAAMSKSIIEGGTPQASDYDTYNPGSTPVIGKKSNLLTFGLIGLGAILLLKK